MSGRATTDDELLTALQGLGRLMNSGQVAARIADAAWAPLGRQGIQIVRMLHRHGELAIARLAAAADMDVAAVSRQLRALERDGLVVRTASDADARVTLVSLTADGRTMARRIRSVGLRHLDATLEAWSEADRADLGRLLTRLVDDLRATGVS